MTSNLEIEDNRKKLFPRIKKPPSIWRLLLWIICSLPATIRPWLKVSVTNRLLVFNLRSSPLFFLYLARLKWRIEEEHTEALATVSTILTLVFLVEVIMKNIAFTPRGYWQSRRNRYDLLVTVVGVIWIVIHCTMKVRLIYPVRFSSLTTFVFLLLWFIALFSEWLILRDRIYGCDPQIFHHHRQTHDSQDADVDGRCVCLQKFLHHIRHVSSCLLLRVSRHHNLWYCKVRRRHRKVRNTYIHLHANM